MRLLQELHLDGNRLTSLHGLEPPPQLRILSVRNNRAPCPPLPVREGTPQTQRELFVKETLVFSFALSDLGGGGGGWKKGFCSAARAPP